MMTDDDKNLLREIAETVSDGDRTRLIIAYWRDGNRAHRTPRGVAYLHLGILSGIIAKILPDEDRR
jgi:hypothetical protein